MNEHRARKRFGQHFLTADDVIQKIVDAIAPRDGETLVEIGPGQAAITRPLAQVSSKLHAIEFDRDLAARLKRDFAAFPSTTIHEADALAFDYRQLGRSLRLVGNLPYNISTPLLFHLLQFADVIADMHFMLQKEVVDRMAALPGSKRYGRLTVMLGCRLDIVSLFDVPPDAFTPPPRVTSTVVRMRPNRDRWSQITNPGALDTLVKTAFSKRRKTLRNALTGVVDDAWFDTAGVNPSTRPEQLDIDTWIHLANTFPVDAL